MLRWAASAGALVLAGLALSSCFNRPPPPPCPEAVRVHDAGYVARFDGAGRDLTNMVFEAELIAVEVRCEIDVDEDDGKAEVGLEVLVTVQAAQGLAGRVDEARVNYFVALADPERKVLVREVFDMAVPFKGNRTKSAVEDILESELIVPASARAADYKVYVGLELTPEEVEYNRSRR